MKLCENGDEPMQHQVSVFGFTKIYCKYIRNLSLMTREI